MLYHLLFDWWDTLLWSDVAEDICWPAITQIAQRFCESEQRIYGAIEHYSFMIYDIFSILLQPLVDVKNTPDLHSLQYCYNFF